MKAKTYILAMLSAFPQTQDVDALMLAFEIGCADIPPEYVCGVAQAYIRGEVERNNHRFAPTVPEFVKRCRNGIAFDQIKQSEPATVLQFPKSKFRQKWDAGLLPQTNAAHRENVRKAMEGEETSFAKRTDTENAG